MQFITIKESHNATDLLVLKSKLESEGIRCHLKDELTTQVLNYLPAMSVELQVLDEDIEKVKEIMEASGDKLTENKILICPKCGSEKIKIKISLKNLFKIISIVFVTIVTFTPLGDMFRSSDFKCKICDFEFK